MISKRMLALFLVGAGVIPYIFSSSSGLQDWATSPLASEHEVTMTAAHTSNTDPSVAQTGPSTGPTQPPAHYSEMLKNGHGITPFSGPTNVSLEGTGVKLEEVINFDVTVPWILGHWARVSTILADLNLKGYRVPLVTGTRESDLAGSLTYYFNPQQQLQRITFTGSSGDTRELAALLVARHSFTRELTQDAGLFLYTRRAGKQAVSELKIRPVAIVRAGDPRQRFEIDLVMNRPAKK
jgi:hypothetical protein